MSHKLILPRVKCVRCSRMAFVAPPAITTKGRKNGLNGKKIPRLLDIFFSRVLLFFFLAEEKSFFDSTGQVPGVPKALYSLGARIHGPPLVDAFSRRHVCFSVVKRAAGLQTGLNQPPLLSLSLSFSLSLSHLLHSFSLPLSADSFPPGISRLLPTIRSSCALLERTAHIHCSVHESVRPGNKLLFVWTDKLVIRPRRLGRDAGRKREKGGHTRCLFKYRRHRECSFAQRGHPPPWPHVGVGRISRVRLDREDKLTASIFLATRRIPRNSSLFSS